jgi:hypothetical protein
MAESSATIDDDELPAEPEQESASERRLNARYFNDLRGFGWPWIGLGIVKAGCVYPTILVAANFAIGIALWAVGVIPKHRFEFAGVIVFLFLAPLIGGVIGLMWSTFVTMFTLPVLHIVLWSMKLKPGFVWLGAFAGGFVAFIATLPISWVIPEMFKEGDAGLAAMFLLLGPGLATIVGQIGGARGGKGAAQAVDHMSANLHTNHLRYALGLLTKPRSDAGANDSKDGSPRFQFRIFHILWLGVWLSLLFTLIRVSRIPYELMLPLFVGWLVYQAATLALGGLIVRRVGPWWRGQRQTRST